MKGGGGDEGVKEGGDSGYCFSSISSFIYLHLRKGEVRVEGVKEGG